MKKLTVSIVTALLLSTTLVAPSKAASSDNDLVAVTSPEAAKATQARTLLARLDEINNMDKSSLTKPEKKQLRKEVRSINKTLSGISGGVYVSVGALLVIILLLVLLL
ncbi:hypothetical protein [Runella sp.]|jgi:predicted PurR-regulated permease PerM|uniref:hypothetical protein n=1 Tax=Runella sp. TaxID=1960881 RepID=UPI00260FBB33|nr:hypothetical protein [Runella sp.]